MTTKLCWVLPVLLVFTACASRSGSEPRYNAISVYTTGRMNLQSYQTPPVRNAFSNREQVVAVVKSLDAKQRMVIVEFLNSQTGNVVSKQVMPCDSGQLRYCGPNELLPAGAYVVKLSSEDGVLLDAQNFTVYGY